MSTSVSAAHCPRASSRAPDPIPNEVPRTFKVRELRTVLQYVREPVDSVGDFVVGKVQVRQAGRDTLTQRLGKRKRACASDVGFCQIKGNEAAPVTLQCKLVQALQNSIYRLAAPCSQTQNDHSHQTSSVQRAGHLLCAKAASDAALCTPAIPSTPSHVATSAPAGNDLEFQAFPSSHRAPQRTTSRSCSTNLLAWSGERYNQFQDK
eukprot:1188093-Rhodomonas_salina.2